MHYHLLSNTPRKALGKQLTNERIHNPLPSSEQYGAQTIKAVDECKNEQHGGICRAIWHATIVKSIDAWKFKQSAASYGVILRANRDESHWRMEE